MKNTDLVERALIAATVILIVLIVVEFFVKGM